MRFFQGKAWSVVALTSSLLLVAGCGSDTAETESYTVTYTEDTTAREGRSLFTINVSNESGPIEGLTPTLSPMMAMNSGYSHSSPHQGCSEVGSGDYQCKVYYLMSSMMGTWTLTLNMDGESASFNPDVMMAMNGNAKHQLKGQSDTVENMMGMPESRPYYIFKDSVSGSTGSHNIALYIATKESMMSFPAVTSSTLLNQGDASYELNINSVTVELSTDGSSWSTASEDGNGYYSVAGLSGLTDGTEGDLHVKLSVNGEQKTTNGLVPVGDGSNDYTTITFTP